MKNLIVEKKNVKELMRSSEEAILEASKVMEMIENIPVGDLSDNHIKRYTSNLKRLDREEKLLKALKSELAEIHDKMKKLI